MRAELRPGEVVLDLGCIAGALAEAEFRDELSTAGFEHVDIQPTNTMHRTDLESMASQLDPALIPPDIDVSSTIDELGGWCSTDVCWAGVIDSAL